MTEPLPDHVRALIAAEAEAPAGGDRGAVRARVLATVGVGGVVAAGSASASASASASGSVPAAGAASVGVAGKLVIVAILAGAVAGGAAIVGGDPVRSTVAPTAVAPAPAIVEPPALMTVEPPAAAASPTPSSFVSPARPAAASSVRAPATASSARAAPVVRRPAAETQVTMLTRALQALRRGDAAAALAAVELDSREHPRGSLSEEREALRVDALVALSRTAEARARARAFLARYPDSLMRDRIARALGAP